MGEGPGPEGRIAGVAFCPPRPKVGVREREFADEVGEARFGWGVGGGADEADGGSCNRFPIDEAATELRIEEEHPQEVAFAAANGREVLEDRGSELVPREDVEVSTEDHRRAVVQVLEQLVRLLAYAFGVSRVMAVGIVLVRELVEVAALVSAETQSGGERVENVP